MSSITPRGKARTHSAISLSPSRNDAGDHWSNFAEYSRTAVSPRAAMSARMPSTVFRTCALFSAFASADWPVLRRRIMKHSPTVNNEFSQYTLVSGFSKPLQRAAHDCPRGCRLNLHLQPHPREGDPTNCLEVIQPPRKEFQRPRWLASVTSACSLCLLRCPRGLRRGACQPNWNRRVRTLCQKMARGREIPVSGLFPHSRDVPLQPRTDR